jgi:hypothetical protein
LKLKFPVSAIVVVLIGCAAPRQLPVAEVRAKLTGMTPPQVLACLGPPGIQRTRGAVTLFSYQSAAPPSPITTPVDASMPDFAYTPYAGDPPMTGFGQSIGPVSGAPCTVNVVFDSGVVRAVTYVGPSGNLLHESDQCTAIVQRCVP